MGDNVDSGGHGLPFFKTVPDKSPIALNGVQDNWAKVRYEKCERTEKFATKSVDVDVAPVV